MTTARTEPVAVGDTAPDFTLGDQNNEDWSLAAQRGRNAALIVFYPLAFTGICSGELAAINSDLATFQNDRVQVVTISVDSPYSHKIFAEREGFEFPLLSDFWPHGAVASSYGVFNSDAGIANRGTFLEDAEGAVVFAEMNPPGEGRDPDVWREAIAKL